MLYWIPHTILLVSQTRKSSPSCCVVQDREDDWTARMESKAFPLTKMIGEWEDSLQEEEEEEDSLAFQPLVRKTELVDGEVTQQGQELNSMRESVFLFPGFQLKRLKEKPLT